MHTTQPKYNLKKIATIAGLALFGLLWIGTEIRFQKYENYAKNHNCKWQIINEKEICR